MFRSNSIKHVTNNTEEFQFNFTVFKLESHYKGYGVWFFLFACLCSLLVSIVPNYTLVSV